MKKRQPSLDLLQGLLISVPLALGLMVLPGFGETEGDPPETGETIPEPEASEPENHGDELASNGLEGLSLEQLMEVELPPVQGASKYEQRVADAPASVSIVTANEIKYYGHRTLADILRSVRGLYVGNDRNFSYLGIRGFNRPGDYNGRTLLLVDGHRINDNIFDSALVGTAFILDIDNIDRVEVIRGPSSSLYGNNAFFGVINVLTKQGRQIDGVEGSVDAGSFDFYKARATVGKLFKNDIEILLSGTYRDAKGDSQLYYPEYDDGDPANNGGVAVGRDYHRSKNFLGTISYHDFTLQGAYREREKAIPTGAFETIFNDPNTQTREEQAYVDLKYQKTFDDDWDVLGRFNYNYYSYRGIYPYENGFPPPAVVLNQDGADGQYLGAELQVTRRLWERHVLTAGAEYRENFQQDQFNYDEDPFFLYFEDERTSHNWGVFAQAEIALLTNLVVNAGVRYDDYGDFGTTLNPRVALIYHPWNETTFKLLYGSAFRAPNAFEAYYAGFGIKTNPDLEPETIDTYEIVFEQELPHRHWFTASAYYYEVNDLLTQVEDPADGLLVYRNLEESDARGLELQLDGVYPFGARARVSYALQQAENSQTGSQLSNSPRHLFKANVVVPIYEDKFLAGLEFQYSDAVKTGKGSVADSYWLVNATLFSQKLADGLEWSVSVYNLFDEDYGYPGAGEHRQAVITQDGRTFRVKLTYRF